MNKPTVTNIIPAGYGLEFIAPDENADKTVIVLGAARGGTSMVAGLVRLLGISMGERIDPPTNEDLDFIEGREPLTAIPDAKHPEHEQVLQRLLQLVKTRNQQHSIWGWKDPLGFVYIAPLLAHIRNPHLVVVFRDFYSISARELTDTHTDTLETLSRAQNNYAWLLEVLKRREAPALLTGYEKAILHPEQFATDLCEFLGMEAKPEFLQAAREFIEPGRGHGHLPADHVP
ncbi:MAG: hypothetical protein COA47_09340 [Robiginitomaculum sp.]|nr:MAG: hypothetical protein COA47_09340 [Robiginitomaculum sp.]